MPVDISRALPGARRRSRHRKLVVLLSGLLVLGALLALIPLLSLGKFVGSP